MWCTYFTEGFCRSNLQQECASEVFIPAEPRRLNKSSERSAAADGFVRYINDPFLVTVKSMLLPQSWQWYRHGISHHLFVSLYVFICLFSFPLSEWHINTSSHINICYANVYFVGVGGIHSSWIWKKKKMASDFPMWGFWVFNCWSDKTKNLKMRLLLENCGGWVWPF